MSPGTTYMIHEAQGMAMGDADSMRKMADTLETVTASAAGLYVEKTGKSQDDILALMKAETWMTPEEAVENGFADGVGGQKSKIDNSFDLSVFRNTPAELKNAMKTKTLDGHALTAEDFIYAGNPHDVSTWSLPWHFPDEAMTKSHLRDALARFDQDEVIPVCHKPEAHAKLVRLCKQYGIEVSDDTKTAEPENTASLDLFALQLEINRRK
jgi:hypothetical protein